MRVYRDFVEEIRGHVNEYNVDMATKVIRSAFDELTFYQTKSLMMSIEWRTNFLYNTIALMASDPHPDSNTWSDIKFCLAVLRARSISFRHVDIILSKKKNCLQKKYVRTHYDDILLYACIFCCEGVDMIEVLVRHGADVDYTTPFGRTSLQLSLEKGRIEIADFLLENGANPVVTGVTPNHVLIRKRRACRDAWLALYTVIIKKCPVNRNVAQNIVKHMVWGTRLAVCWDLKEWNKKRIKGSL